MPIRTVFLLGILAFCTAGSLQAEPLQISGVYPHLRTTNKEGECELQQIVLPESVFTPTKETGIRS